MMHKERPADTDQTLTEPSSAGGIGRGRQVAHLVLFAALLALLGTAAAMAVPFWKLYKAGSMLEQEERSRMRGDLPQALALLDQAEARVLFHPPIVQECRRERVRCQAALGHFEEAEQQAKVMHDHPLTPSERPAAPRSIAGAGVLVTSMSEWMCNRILAWMLGSEPSWDPWAGYRALLHELDEQEKPDTLRVTAERIARDYPGNPVVAYRRTSAPAPRTAQPPPTPRTAAAASATRNNPTKTHWGVVIRPQTFALNQRGERYMPLAPGTLVDVSALKTVGGSNWAVCAFEDAGVTVGGMLVPAAQIEMRDGALSSATPRERDLRARHARLLVQLEALTGVKSPTRSAADPPRPRRTGPARQKLDAYYDEVARVRTEMDKATGDRRMKLLDQLRKMKYEEAQLVEQAKKESGSVPAPAAPAPTNAAPASPQVAAVEKELAAVERELENL